MDRFNLRPQEKRLVVGIFVVVFIVLNIWLVWPHFKDWNLTRAAKVKTKENLAKYRKEIAQSPQYETRLKKLADQGAQVLPEEMAIQLRRTVENKARESGLIPSGINPGPKSAAGRTNEFFEEQSLNMNFVNTGDKELIDFLFNLSAGTSMIRVRDLSVFPDPSRIKFQGNVTLIASFQKKPVAKMAAAQPVATAPIKAAPSTNKSIAPPKLSSAPPKTNSGNKIKKY
ncbi:MAG: hypothetical protein M3Y82_13275 [Verrucomicrobiota bacterium]|nr:hypothetical protein [Verrucomicrobiota bacterium]